MLSEREKLAWFTLMGTEVCEGCGLLSTSPSAGYICTIFRKRSFILLHPNFSWARKWWGMWSCHVRWSLTPDPASSPAQPVCLPSSPGLGLRHPRNDAPPLSLGTAQAQRPVTNFLSHLSYEIFSYLKHFLINYLSPVDEVNISFDR